MLARGMGVIIVAAISLAALVRGTRVAWRVAHTYFNGVSRHGEGLHRNSAPSRRPSGGRH